MEMGMLSKADAQVLLKEQLIVPAKSDGKPSPKKLKSWSGNTLSNFHHHKEAIVSA